MKKIVSIAAVSAALVIGVIACNKKADHNPAQQSSDSYESFLVSLKAHSNQVMQSLLAEHSGQNKSNGDPTNSNNPLDASGVAHNKMLDYIGGYISTITNTAVSVTMPVINADGESINYTCSTTNNKVLKYGEDYLDSKNPGTTVKVGIVDMAQTTIDNIKNKTLAQNLSYLSSQGVVDSKVSDLITSYYNQVCNVTDANAVIDYSIDYENSIVAADSKTLTDDEKTLALQYVTIYKYSTNYWKIAVPNNPSSPWKNYTQVGGPTPDSLGALWGFMWCSYHTGPGGFGNNDICNCHGNPNCVSNTAASVCSAMFAFLAGI